MERGEDRLALLFGILQEYVNPANSLQHEAYCPRLHEVLYLIPPHRASSCPLVEEMLS
jgi:hypothetical protein